MVVNRIPSLHYPKAWRAFCYVKSCFFSRRTSISHNHHALAARLSETNATIGNISSVLNSKDPTGPRNDESNMLKIRPLTRAQARKELVDELYTEFREKYGYYGPWDMFESSLFLLSHSVNKGHVVEADFDAFICHYIHYSRWLARSGSGNYKNFLSNCKRDHFDLKLITKNSLNLVDKVIGTKSKEILLGLHDRKKVRHRLKSNLTQRSPQTARILTSSKDIPIPI